MPKHCSVILYVHGVGWGCIPVRGGVRVHTCEGWGGGAYL